MAAAESSPDRDKNLCGGPLRHRDGTCTRPAGWGTPHPGIGRCKLHGGSTPSHVAAAQRQQADGVVRRLLLDPSSQPVTDPVLSLQKLAGGLEGMVAELGARVNQLSALSPEGNASQLRAEVLLLERLIGHLRGLLVDMARLGLEDRVTAVLEAQGEQVYELVAGIGRAVLAELVLLLAEHPGALSVLEAEYERVYGRVAQAELGALHELETGRAS